MRWLRVEDVRLKTGMSKSTIYRMIADNEFPPATNPPGCGFSIWVESEVDAWMKKKVAQGRGQPIPQEAQAAA